MVVHVIGDASSTTEHLRLFRSLDALSTSEDAAGGDADGDESIVIRSPVKLGGDMCLSAILVVFLEEFLDLSAAGGAGEVEGGSVAVVDHVGVVGRGGHVKVQVQADFVALFWGEAVDVVLGAEEAVLLCRPEEESHGVGDFEFCEGSGDDKVANYAGAVVVDAGT